MGESLLELRGEYETFLRGERYNLTDRISTAIDDVRHMMRSGSGGSSKGASAGTVPTAVPRVTVTMAELRSQGLSERLRRDPLRHLRALEAACHLIATEEQPGYDKEGEKIKIALTGPVGAAPASPRQLTSNSLRQLVCVEGVATKVSTIKPKIVRSVHFCPETGKHTPRDYVDATDPNLGLPALDASGMELKDRYVSITSSVYPTKTEEGHALETEFGLSSFKDHQTITLQEMPEKAPMGQLPRSVELVLDHDLVDKIKPGDRVMVVGVFRALATASQGQQTSSGVFRTVVLVNNVQIMGRNVSSLSFLPNDIRTIRSLAKHPDILGVLGRSISPSIHGHTVIKKALALQLLAGVEKNLDNGTHLRGDINILMVGDPSTAKSQLLRSAMTIAPLAVSTTGKGSSGVGLTAAVTSDPDTNERRLEAGAMVLADRGLVCVDEFDKMGENDRVAIHEAMEQQTVTIAKAGIHASLNARCSVLAAANPVYGQYDRRRRIQENIGLPDSLLSRFDLLFVVLDQMDPELDRKIASHVIRGHRSRTVYDDDAQGGDNHDDDDDSDDEDVGDTVHTIWQRCSGNQGDATVNEDDPHAHDVLRLDFLRKYLHYAKTRTTPVLTNEAREFIASRYAEMRARQDDRTIPVTARSLETVIRLASAHAKARLSDTVLTQDCHAAMDILSFALYHEQNSGATAHSGSTDGVGEKRSIVSDTEGDVSDDGAESNSKRARLQDDNDTINKNGSNRSALEHEICTLVDSENGMSVETLLSTLKADEATIQAAMDVLVEKELIMVSDGSVFRLE